MIGYLKFRFGILLCLVIILTLFVNHFKDVTKNGESGNMDLSFTNASQTFNINVTAKNVSVTGDASKRYQGNIVIKGRSPKDVPAKHDVRILCWIMTHAGNYKTRTVHVNNTWARRCTKYVFMIGQSSAKMDVPFVQLDIPEQRSHLTGKSMLAFRYIYTHYFDDADWFMKADDDTYVIMEDLRDFLREKNPDDAVFFGQKFNSLWRNPHSMSYVSGGAGYVLSREALRRLGENGSEKRKCLQDGVIEDYDMSRCLQNLGVKLGNSSDSLGRNRFNCFNPEYIMFDRLPKWYEEIEGNGAKRGLEAISDKAISFHYVPGKYMHVMDLLIYHLKIRKYSEYNTADRTLIKS